MLTNSLYLWPLKRKNKQTSREKYFKQWIKKFQVINRKKRYADNVPKKRRTLEMCSSLSFSLSLLFYQKFISLLKKEKKKREEKCFRIWWPYTSYQLHKFESERERERYREKEKKMFKNIYILVSLKQSKQFFEGNFSLYDCGLHKLE